MSPAPLHNTPGPAPELDHFALNAMINLFTPEGKLQIERDREAAHKFFIDHVNQNTVFFHNLKEKLKYLVDNGYYEEHVLDQYSFNFLRDLWDQAYEHRFRFSTFLGAYKYYTNYTLKTFDGKRYLERYEDRVCMVALTLARGDETLASSIVDEIISGRFQPATPTFANAGKQNRGDLVSCFLLRVEDNMESIGRAVNAALQLSKRGGGVALNLTNLREVGAPIKKNRQQASGVVPVMKILDDSFAYANQLGTRDGAGAVYLSIHHPDIVRFLDTKKENADERTRIKTLSTGIVVTDVAMRAAQNNEDIYLFSPYDIERHYHRPMSDISITELYQELIDNPAIKKEKIPVRELFSQIAAIQFESGYPYIIFEDTINRANPIAGRISMSNLCTEILQVSTPSVLAADLSYVALGEDISCNLGSLNIANTIDSPDFGNTVETAIRTLTAVSEMSQTDCAPSIANGNQKGHAIGLGAMNLHGALAREHILYGSDEGIDFTDAYFRTVTYHAIRSSCALAREKGRAFDGFEHSAYASGAYFDKYTESEWHPATSKIAGMFSSRNVAIPTREDWSALRDEVMQHGIYNRNLQAVPPTGSISYINNSTASIHPIASKIETRKEGRLGRVYYPAPYLSNETIDYYQDAYEIGPKKIIDTYAAATKHVDQGLSLTLFFSEDTTTRDINRAQAYAWLKGIKTLYYVRGRTATLAGTEAEGCVSCSL